MDDVMFYTMGPIVLSTTLC